MTRVVGAHRGGPPAGSGPGGDPRPGASVPARRDASASSAAAAPTASKYTSSRRPARHQVGERGVALGQERGDRRGDGRGRPARRLDAVAAGRGLGHDRPGADGRRQLGHVEAGRCPEGQGRCASGATRAGELAGRALEHDAARRRGSRCGRPSSRPRPARAWSADADAPLPQSGHGGPDGDAPLGVDAGRGLVEEGDLGPADERQRRATGAAARRPRGGARGWPPRRRRPTRSSRLVRRQGVGVVARRRGRGPGAARASGRRRPAGA